MGYPPLYVNDRSIVKDTSVPCRRCYRNHYAINVIYPVDYAVSKIVFSRIGRVSSQNVVQHLLKIFDGLLLQGSSLQTGAIGLSSSLCRSTKRLSVNVFGAASPSVRHRLIKECAICMFFTEAAGILVLCHDYIILATDCNYLQYSYCNINTPDIQPFFLL